MLSGLGLKTFGPELVNNLCDMERVCVGEKKEPCVQHDGAFMCYVLNWSEKKNTLQTEAVLIVSIYCKSVNPHFPRPDLRGFE